MKPKRSKKRFFYYFAYFWMNPFIRLFYSMLTYPEKRETYAYKRFFCYGTDYERWRMFMADMEVKDKQTHDLIIYMPVFLVLCLVMILIAW